MKRFQQEKNIMKRRCKEDLLRRCFFTNMDKKDLGRYRKSSPYDCGNPKCQVCHSEKFPRRELTLSEKKAALKMKEADE